MQKKLFTWQFMYTNVQLHTPVMLLYVLQSKGSSPGRQGFFMAVNSDGEMYGSVGGGIMEHKMVELAKTRLQQSSNEHSIYHQYHDKTAATQQSGMICSGQQTIFMYTLQEKDMQPLQKIIETLQLNKNATLQLSAEGLLWKGETADSNFYFELKEASNFLYREKIGYTHYLHIIGGGHCALALSQLMSSMDFYIQLYEERTDLHTMVENNYVHKKNIVASYSTLNHLIAGGSNIYVIIMTVGYRTDREALRALLHTPFAYFGILGSKSKIEKMMQALLKEGVSTEKLQTLYAPAGVAIKSQTPEEIAVSIAAEIIKVKNNLSIT